MINQRPSAADARTAEGPGPRSHPLRRILAAELHARPSAPVVAPARLAHLALVTGETKAEDERRHLAALCARYLVNAPAQGVNHFSAEFPAPGGAWGLTWERHTEFSTYTFRFAGLGGTPFGERGLTKVPPDWLAELAGELLVSIELVLLGRDTPVPGSAELGQWLLGAKLVGSEVADGRAKVWSDFTVDSSGSVRVLVQDFGLEERRAGRLVQRLLEIETYRMMALLALPLARQVAPRLTEIEGRLADLAASLNALKGVEDERALLHTLSGLAAEIETLAAQTPYRLGAARAYQALVLERISELREKSMSGLLTIGGFLERRLSPAMRTCINVEERLENLSRRVTRTGNLLRTRVDVTLEQQNSELLVSMNRRARLQLRLQQTVEGLSIAAITYYAVGLVVYAAQALESMDLPVSPKIAAAVAIPIIAGLVWLGLRRVRRSLGE